MADAISALRRGALDGRAFSSVAVSIEPVPPCARLSLRAPVSSVPALSQALGLLLPRRSCTSLSSGSRIAMWLGPDEWLVADTDGTDLAALCAGSGAIHSAVDVSHRNVGIAVSGPGAETVLAAGCPLDLSFDLFPKDTCVRTILGKIEIVILRTGENSFRIECWRSFSAYAFDFLREAARGA